MEVGTESCQFILKGVRDDAASVQKVFIWRYDCSYSDLHLVRISQDLTAEAGPFYNYTKSFDWIKTLNYQSDDSKVRSFFRHSNMIQQLYRVNMTEFNNNERYYSLQ